MYGNESSDITEVIIKELNAAYSSDNDSTTDAETPSN